MKKLLVLTFVAVGIPCISFAQAEGEIICQSIVSPTNVKVFEGDECPFGWVKQD